VAIMLGDEWVLHPVITRDIGLSYNHLRSMIDRKVLARGVHWMTQDGKRFYNPRAIQEWLNTKALEQREPVLRSDSNTKASHTRSTSTGRRTRPTLRMRLGIS